MEASDRLTFLSKCPTPGCKAMPSHEFGRAELAERLKAGPVHLSCIRCDQQWVAGAAEREGMRKLLAR